MNEIRKNNEQEITIVEAKFKMPKIIKFLYIFIIAQFIFLFLIGISTIGDIEYHDNSEMQAMEIAFPIVFVPILITVFVSHANAIKKSSCIITNKRIKGVTAVFTAKKTFSYRLDEIDNVEIVSSGPIHILVLYFSQGHGPARPAIYTRNNYNFGNNAFRIAHVSNLQEVYDKLSQLLCSIKNDKDLQVDIEMSKIETENRKAVAIENMANNIGGNIKPTNRRQGSDYISQLITLKELLDSGIITQEEFDNKKQELLK